MKVSRGASTALCAVFVAGFLTSVYPSLAQSAEGQRQSAPSVVAANEAFPKVSELPDSPGTTKSAVDAEQQSTQQTAAPSTNQTSNPTLQTAPQKPVGTATAEAPNSNGVAASQPAGVAIAPKKQRRVRTIVLRVGAIAGAAVAVGTVVGLTEATSSKPPGAR
jgi:FtsZ-interacting cell division protein ZipA